jgi:hypothetical protein
VGRLDAKDVTVLLSVSFAGILKELRLRLEARPE